MTNVEENIKKSKRNYGDKYNKENVNVQLNRDLINKLKEKLDKQTSIKSFIENLIKNNI
jgi:hypothetical protein